MNTDSNDLLARALRGHFGHHVVISRYTNKYYCLECEDCWEVILDAQLYTIVPRDDVDGGIIYGKEIEEG